MNQTKQKFLACAELPIVGNSWISCLALGELAYTFSCWTFAGDRPRHLPTESEFRISLHRKMGRDPATVVPSSWAPYNQFFWFLRFVTTLPPPPQRSNRRFDFDFTGWHFYEWPHCISVNFRSNVVDGMRDICAATNFLLLSEKPNRLLKNSVFTSTSGHLCP